ncbi:hypothetical protein V6N11_012522 [Hibiscus sabdariffa]|uniref:RNase H type-1 domain-containing protein n=2 Tax=Hibiscus sabdariffa TaxID=183260 RepID=A0ABR2BD25_9ROSI
MESIEAAMQQVRWHHPTNGWVRNNVDGAVGGSNQVASIGEVAREDQAERSNPGWEVRIRHINREANMAADKLTKLLKGQGERYSTPR